MIKKEREEQLKNQIKLFSRLNERLLKIEETLDLLKIELSQLLDTFETKIKEIGRQE